MDSGRLARIRRAPPGGFLLEYAWRPTGRDRRRAADSAYVRVASVWRGAADRRLGEMLIESAEDGTRATPKASKRTDLVGRDDKVQTLADIGITKTQSATCQKIAEIPEPEFEERIAIAKAVSGEVKTTALLHKHPAPLGPPPPTKAIAPPVGTGVG